MSAETRMITGRKAKTYDLRGPLWNSIKAKHLNLVSPKSGQRVLDVGCGTGKSLYLLSQMCDPSVKLHGVEPSGDMLDQAKGKLRKRAKLHKGLAQKLPYPDDSFNWVISTQVMHHLPLPEKKKMLQEMHRVLKPGGVMVISDWGQPTNLPGKFLAFLWRNHAYVEQNQQILNVPTMQKTGFTSVQEDLQFDIVHHIHAKK